jgi:hypothetical protein
LLIAQHVNITTVLLFVFGLPFTSCGQTTIQESNIHYNWIKIVLPNGWTLKAPKGFYVETLQGVD